MLIAHAEIITTCTLIPFLPFEFVSEVETAQGLEWDKGHFGF